MIETGILLIENSISERGECDSSKVVSVTKL